MSQVTEQSGHVLFIVMVFLLLASLLLLSSLETLKDDHFNTIDFEAQLKAPESN